MELHSLARVVAQLVEGVAAHPERGRDLQVRHPVELRDEDRALLLGELVFDDIAQLCYSKRFLPNRLTGTDDIRCLGDRERIKLNQIMGNAYCHIFAFVEEYIIPQALEAAHKDVYGEETRLRTLLRFAEEETKHQELFRRSMELFERGFGVKCGLIAGREEVAKACSASPGSAATC